jgi:hypothetical protein
MRESVCYLNKRFVCLYDILNCQKNGYGPWFFPSKRNAVFASTNKSHKKLHTFLYPSNKVKSFPEFR